MMRLLKYRNYLIFINLIAKPDFRSEKTEEVYLLLPEGERNKIEKKDNIGTV